jgi:hypothetical protein
MSNTHTPSNILFSRAFSDTSYNDLMKISYTGDTTIYSTSESATSTAGALVVYGGVGISGKVNIKYGRVELFVGGVGVSNLVSVQAIPVYTSSASTTEVLDQIR